MQHDDAGILPDLVDEMRGPENREASCPAETADVFEQKLPADDVETDRRLVEQKQPRIMQESACDLDPSPLPAAQPSHIVATAFGKIDAAEFGRDPRFADAARNSVQRRMVAQVLLDREIKVESRLLEDDAHARESRDGVTFHRRPKHLDRAAAVRVETRNQGEEGALAGPVEPEQHREIARSDRERYIPQGLARAV